MKHSAIFSDFEDKMMFLTALVGALLIAYCTFPWAIQEFFAALGEANSRTAEFARSILWSSPVNSHAAIGILSGLFFLTIGRVAFCWHNDRFNSGQPILPRHLIIVAMVIVSFVVFSVGVLALFGVIAVSVVGLGFSANQAILFSLVILVIAAVLK